MWKLDLKLPDFNRVPAWAFLTLVPLMLIVQILLISRLYGSPAALGASAISLAVIAAIAVSLAVWLKKELDRLNRSLSEKSRSLSTNFRAAFSLWPFWVQVGTMAAAFLFLIFAYETWFVHLFATRLTASYVFAGIFALLWGVGLVWFVDDWKQAKEKVPPA